VTVHSGRDWEGPVSPKIVYLPVLIFGEVSMSYLAKVGLNQIMLNI